jgi:hypothetical protein
MVLGPLRKQRDVSKVPVAPTAVLLEDSSAPPTTTIPHAQGHSTSPTATLACTQGSCTSLPDTLAHCYSPVVHLDPLLASIKGRSRLLPRGCRGFARRGRRADGPALSLPSRDACNPYYGRHPPSWARDNTSHPPLLSCVPSRADPSGLGRAATTNSLVGPEDPPPGPKRRQYLTSWEMVSISSIIRVAVLPR